MHSRDFNIGVGYFTASLDVGSGVYRNFAINLKILILKMRASFIILFFATVGLGTFTGRVTPSDTMVQATDVDY